MTTLQIVVLALIQGLSEFLPVSSSAHLILGSALLGWPDQGLVFDLATHLGTLVAVLVYFRRDLFSMARAWLEPADTEPVRHDRRLGLLLVAASVPTLLAGALFHGLVETHLRDVSVIAWTTLVFGLLLWFADARFPATRDLGRINVKSALLIGLAQVAALVPGVSRSGVTITAGRMLGFTGEAAARFSFLLSIPIISAAGAYGLLRVVTGSAEIDWQQFLVAAALSAAAGWVCIAAFLALLKRVGLFPFVVYRLTLAAALMWLIYGGP